MFISTKAARVAAIALLAPLAVIGVAGGNAIGATVVTPAVVVPAIEPTPPAVVPAIDQTPEKPITRSIEAPRSLAGLVQEYGSATAAGADLTCLATAVYFESKSEPLAGQLAVAHVILNRVASGRFASSICGVVKQPSQFSFVRHGVMPRPVAGDQWRNAIAIAQIAMKELYASPVPGALYFHARYVSPAWGKRPLGKVGNHIFYR